MESTLDLWADDMEPHPTYSATVYHLTITKLRGRDRPSVYVEVEDGDLISVQGHSWFNQKNFRDMTWEERKEVYDWLTEWEFAEWHRIGPEDSELFATTKLTDIESI